MYKWLFIPIAIFYLLLRFAISAGVGDFCVLQSTGVQGKCVKLIECAPVFEAFKKDRVFPQTCGYVGTAPLVCCPNDVQATTTTTTTTTKTTTRKPTTTKPVPTEVKEPTNRKPGEVSGRKCREYAKYIYKKDSPTLAIFNEDIERNECGFKVVELIVGGTAAKVKEFPHMALIGFEAGTPGDMQWLCAGSIISEQFVLTAGHCVFHQQFGECKRVRLGLTDLNQREHMQEIEIKERIAFPLYTPSSQYNDIAILKLEIPADLNPYVRPACLYAKREIPFKKAIASGWGRTYFGGGTPETLLKVTLEYFTHKECNATSVGRPNRRLNKGIVEASQICYGSKDGSAKDTCQGDSGGPLQIYHVSDDIKCMYDIVGVTSFGKACGIGASPGVYTRVSEYIQWIEDTVWPK